MVIKTADFPRTADKNPPRGTKDPKNPRGKKKCVVEWRGQKTVASAGTPPPTIYSTHTNTAALIQHTQFLWIFFSGDGRTAADNYQNIIYNTN